MDAIELLTELQDRGEIYISIDPESKIIKTRHGRTVNYWQIINGSIECIDVRNF